MTDKHSHGLSLFCSALLCVALLCVALLWPTLDVGQTGQLCRRAEVHASGFVEARARGDANASVLSPSGDCQIAQPTLGVSVRVLSRLHQHSHGRRPCSPPTLRARININSHLNLALVYVWLQFSPMALMAPMPPRSCLACLTCLARISYMPHPQAPGLSQSHA